MSIFVDDKTRVVYQGLTGSAGRFYGLRNRAYGTQVVAGTNPSRGGTDVEGIPVFSTVKEAVERRGATGSCVFVPAAFVESAVIEAAEAGSSFIAVITEGVPAQDEARFYNRLSEEFPNVRLLGPNCPGIITPGECNIGITAGEIATPGGPVGIVSRSGTLTYQALYELTLKGIGVTTCVGIGGDPVPGTTFIDCLQAFEADPNTKAVIMIGEIGGSEEEKAAEFIGSWMSKPILSCIAWVTAPRGWLLGRQALDVWETLGRPRPFRILELGAGSGALAEPLFAFLRDHSTETLYTIDERSPSLREVQRRRLTDAAFRWDGVDEPAHFVVANEVADALPVHRVIVREGRLRELHVGLGQGGTFTWVETPTARAELE